MNVVDEVEGQPEATNLSVSSCARCLPIVTEKTYRSVWRRPTLSLGLDDDNDLINTQIRE